MVRQVLRPRAQGRVAHHRMAARNRNIVSSAVMATTLMATTLSALFGLIFFLVIPQARAISPLEFGLTGGDLIRATQSGDPDVYIVNEHGYKRLILSPKIFDFYGHLTFRNVKDVSVATKDAFQTSSVVRNCEANDPKVYGFASTAEDGGLLRWVNTNAEKATADDPDFFNKVFCINSSELAWYPKDTEDYRSVRQIPQYVRRPPAIFHERLKQEGTDTPLDQLSPEGGEIPENAIPFQTKGTQVQPLLFGGPDVEYIQLGLGNDLPARQFLPEGVAQDYAEQRIDEYIIEFSDGISSAEKKNELDQAIEAQREILRKTTGAQARGEAQQRIENLAASKGTTLQDHKKELIQKQKQQLAAVRNFVSAIEVKKTFSSSFNGFHAALSEFDAERLRDAGYGVWPNQTVNAVLMDSVPLISADHVWTTKDSQGRDVTGQGVRIAIIDTGIDYTHPDLGGCLGVGCKVEGGYDVVNKDTDPMDDHGHGTHVGAIAAGVGALKGVAPGATLYGYKVLSAGGSGYWSWVIEGIERAVDPNGDGDLSDGAHVINMSLGGSGNPDDAVARAVDNAVKAGVVVAVAAGNSGSSARTVLSPGVARKALTVAASTKLDTLASFSSRGPVVWNDQSIGKPDVAGPGLGICAAEWDGWLSSRRCVDDAHIAISGTSMASPHLAGVAALIRQAHPDWTPEQIKSVIKGTARDLGWSPFGWGAGRVEALQAVSQTGVPPLAELEPLALSGVIKIIRGRIASEDLKRWSLAYSPLGAMLWTEFVSSTTLPGMELGILDGLNLADGEYVIRLLLEEYDGQRAVDYGYAFIDKLNVASPLNWDVYRAGSSIQIKVSFPESITPDEFIYEYKFTGGRILIGRSATSTFTWNTEGLDTGWHTLWVTMAARGILSEESVRIYLDRTIKKGWPQRIQWDTFRCGTNSTCAYWPGSMESVLTDIDSNGTRELIVFKVGNPSKLLAYTDVGTMLWEASMGRYIPSYHVPVAEDMDGDGKKEIFFVSTGVTYGFSAIYGFDSSGNHLTGWPSHIPKLYSPSLIIADVNADGVKEMIARGSLNSYYSGNDVIFVIGKDGKILSQFDFPHSYWQGFFPPVTPAVGNFDDDADLELVIARASANAGPIRSATGTIIGWNNEGEVHVVDWEGGLELPGWPVKTNGFPIFSSPAVGDLENDGRLDVVVGLSYVSQNGWFYAGRGPDLTAGGLHALERNGKILPGWPVRQGYSYWSSPSLGDVDGGGDLEIAVSYLGYETEVFNHDGTTVKGWPKYIGAWDWYSTIQGDISGDGAPEILTHKASFYAPGVHAWSATGTVIPGFPKKTESSYETVISIGDADGNGRMDIAGSSNFDWDGVTRRFKFRSSLYMWEMDESYKEANLQWPTFHHDEQRTGLLQPPSAELTVVSPNGGELWRRGQTKEITWRFNEFPQGALAQIQLRHSGSTSTIERVIATSTLVASGSYSWTISNDIPLGEYLIWIEAITSSAASVSDFSDAAFTIGEEEKVFVALTVTPSSGVAPPEVMFSADVSGTAEGPINYYFWWDCNDASTDVFSASSTCGSPAEPSVGNIFPSSAEDPKSIYHTYHAIGTFVAKVVAERGTAAPAESRATITVFAKPDLVVQSPSFSPQAPIDGDSITFWGTVRNQGGSSAATSSLRLRIDVAGDGTWDVVSATTSVKALPSDATTTVTVPSVWNGTSGAHLYEICADAGSGIVESDETNNCVSQTFTVFAKPDLVLQSLEVVGTLVEGETLTLSGVVRNQGGSTSTISLTEFKIGGGLIGSRSANPLAANASEENNLSWTAVVGTHTLELCADSDSATAESDEKNNCGTKTFTVSAPPPSPPPPPSGGGGGGGGGTPSPPSPPPAPSSPFPPTKPTGEPSPEPPVSPIGAPGAGETAAPSDYGLKEGDVIRATGDFDVYIINEHGYKRLFLNPIIFEFYLHLGGWEAVREVSSETRDAFVTSSLFRNCETDDPKVYGIEVAGEDMATLHWVAVTAEQAIAGDPEFFQEVFCINNAEFAWYPSGAAYMMVSEVPVYSR